MKDKTPNTILEKLKSGDDRPLMEVYRLYRNDFINWAKTTFQANEEQAKDAFQEALVSFYENVTSGNLTSLTCSVKTYIFQLGKHKVLNILKKEQKITYNEVFQLINDIESMENYMEEENLEYSKEQISKAIKALPEDCQKVLKLYYFEEYDMESIAREMNYKNADTAKSKKSVCMKKMMQELKKLSMIFIF